MIPLKDTDLQKYLLISPHINTELTLWKQLSFSFDMDDEPRRHRNEHTHSSRRSRSTPEAHGDRTDAILSPDVQDTDLLAQLTDATRLPSHVMPQTQSYGSLRPFEEYASASVHDSYFDQRNMRLTSLPTLSSMDFPWNQFLPPHTNQDQHSAMLSRGMHSTGLPQYPPNHRRSITVQDRTESGSSTDAGYVPQRTPGISTPNAIASSSNSDPADPDTQTEAETNTIAEEKRRRNTAASARFRIKKKQKTINLERLVSDLTGRAKDLEREAADLRRENGWLKEIVMLKGSGLAGVNIASHMAASQRNREATSQGRSVHQRENESDDDQSLDQPEGQESSGHSVSEKSGKQKMGKK